MSGTRQIFLGFFMALLFSAIVLGSLSLSLLEAGYRLGYAPATEAAEVVFLGEPILVLAGDEMESNAPLSPREIPVILEPSPVAESCNYPKDWVKITVQTDNTLKSLAHLTNSSVQLLKDGNCLKAEGLSTGSELYVPIDLLQPTVAPTRRSYSRPVYAWTPYPPAPSRPTSTPWVPTMTPVTPPPTQPPTLPPTSTATALPPTPLPTAQPPTPFPTAEPTSANPPPTSPPTTEPPPTNPPPTSPPTTEPPQPTPVPPTPQPQPTSEPLPLPTEPRLPPPPQPTAPPLVVPTLPPEQQVPAPTPIIQDFLLTTSLS